MVISSEEEIKAEIQIPENVKAEILDNVIIVEGRLGKLKKNIIEIPVVVLVQDKTIVVQTLWQEKERPCNNKYGQKHNTKYANWGREGLYIQAKNSIGSFSDVSETQRRQSQYRKLFR